jgi:hypothetical protein
LELSSSHRRLAMDVDVAGSLEYFTRHGGCCCSCEVLLNVAALASESV